jgi:hypothetical protein
MTNAFGNDACFSCACASDDEQGAVAMFDRALLRGIHIQGMPARGRLHIE